MYFCWLEVGHTLYTLYLGIVPVVIRGLTSVKYVTWIHREENLVCQHCLKRRHNFCRGKVARVLRIWQQCKVQLEKNKQYQPDINTKTMSLAIFLQIHTLPYLNCGWKEWSQIITRSKKQTVAACYKHCQKARPYFKQKRTSRRYQMHTLTVAFAFVETLFSK